MPNLLTSGSKSPKAQMLEILDQTTVKTWEKDVARLKKLAAAV